MLQKKLYLGFILFLGIAFSVPFVSSASLLNWNENFDSYSLGQLNGKGGWYSESSNAYVTASTSQSIFSSVTSDTSAKYSYKDTGETLMDGGVHTLTGWVNVTNEAFQFRLGVASSTGSVASFICSVFNWGSVGAFHDLYLDRNSSQVLIASNINRNTWVQVGLQVDTSGHRCRGNYQGGAWSSWLNWDTVPVDLTHEELYVSGDIAGTGVYVDSLVLDSTSFGGATIQYPYSGLLVDSKFGVYKVQLTADLATTTLKIYVKYGNSGSGSYTYTSSSALINSSNIGLMYSVSSNNCYPTLFQGCVDYSAGTNGVSPVTWYAQGYVFNDCLKDGQYACLVAETPEVSFIYYPGSIVFQGQGATSTGSYVNVYSSSTTCPYGIVCTGSNGSQFYIDQNGNVVTMTSTSTISNDAWGRFYNLWQPLRYKFPWGYVTAIADLVGSIGSSTATSTWWLQSTSTTEWLTRDKILSGLDMMKNAGRVIGPALFPIRRMTDGLMWLGTAYVVVKLFVLML